MNQDVGFVPVVALARAWAAMAQDHASCNGRVGSARLKVFLDCDARVKDFIRAELGFVEYVGHGREADVRVRVTTMAARGRVRRYSVGFIGTGRFEGIEAVARVGVARRRSSKSRGRALAIPIKEAAAHA